MTNVLQPVQPDVTVPVRMEGPAQLLTLAPVLWGGLECSVKQVGIVTQVVFVCSCLCQHLLYKYFLLLCVLDWKAVSKVLRKIDHEYNQEIIVVD